MLLVIITDYAWIATAAGPPRDDGAGRLFAKSDSGVRALTVGRYVITGRNPDRTSYAGIVDISRGPNGGYVFDWKVGTSA